MHLEGVSHVVLFWPPLVVFVFQPFVFIAFLFSITVKHIEVIRSGDTRWGSSCDTCFV